MDWVVVRNATVGNRPNLVNARTEVIALIECAQAPTQCARLVAGRDPDRMGCGDAQRAGNPCPLDE
jgi:hypothetical protein